MEIEIDWDIRYSIDDRNNAVWQMTNEKIIAGPDERVWRERLLPHFFFVSFCLCLTLRRKRREATEDEPRRVITSISMREYSTIRTPIPSTLFIPRCRALLALDDDGTSRRCVE